MINLDYSLLFYPISILIVIFSILAIKFENIFYSLISAIFVFFLVGVVFFMLGSEYNAIIQIAIYGIAIPITLGLAVMFTNSQSNKKENKNSKPINYLTVLCMGIFILSIIYLILMSLSINATSFNILPDIKHTTIQSVKVIGEGIFIKYVYAFELVSLLLTIIVVGLTIFKGELKCKK